MRRHHTDFSFTAPYARHPWSIYRCTLYVTRRDRDGQPERYGLRSAGSVIALSRRPEPLRRLAYDRVWEVDDQTDKPRIDIPRS